MTTATQAAPNVPILDLNRTRRRIAPQLAERWERVLGQTSFILGPEVKEFEAAFAAYQEVQKILMEDVPTIFLYHTQLLVTAKATLHDVTLWNEGAVLADRVWKG